MKQAKQASEDTFVFCPSFYQQLCAIRNNEVRLRLYEAVAEYGVLGTVPDFTDIDPTGLMDGVFAAIKYVIDSTKSKRSAISNARSEAGKNGGAPKGNQNARKQAKTSKTSKTSVDVDVDGGNLLSLESKEILSTTTTTTTAREDSNILGSEDSVKTPLSTPEKSSAKKVPPQPVPDGAYEYIPIGEVAGWMKANTQWFEAFCMNNRLDPEFVKRKIDEFARECENNGEVSKDKRDCIRHFHNWLRKVKQQAAPATASTPRKVAYNRHPATTFDNSQHFSDDDF